MSQWRPTNTGSADYQIFKGKEKNLIYEKHFHNLSENVPKKIELKMLMDG